jgi:hypothetical protein
MPGIERGVIHRDAVGVDELRAGQQRVDINIGLTAWTLFMVFTCTAPLRISIERALWRAIPLSNYRLQTCLAASRSNGVAAK